MLLRSLLTIGLFLALSPLHAAEEVSCPRLADAVLVGTCPTEADLDRLTDAICADDPICADAFKVVRQRKNTALWETEGGRFAGYISCLLPAEKIKSAALEGMLLQKKGLTVIGCLYEHGVSLEHRTKSACASADGRAITSETGEQRIDCRSGACKVTCQ